MIEKENKSFYRAPGSPDLPDRDYMVTATALDGKVRALAVCTTRLCREALRIHQTSPSATAALGRFMTGGLLLAAGLKGEDDTMTVSIRCDGPIRGMTSVCNSSGGVKGYCLEPVVPTVNRIPGKLDIAATVGSGMLTVIKDLGMKNPYVGSSELISGEIAEDFAYYLGVSEQIRSVVSLGVLLDADGVRHAGGFLVQLMPNAGEDTIEYLQKRATGGFPDVTFLLSEGMSPEQILDVFLGDPGIQYLSGKPVQYECGCTRERMERGLIALGPTQLSELAADPKGVEIRCDFCGIIYSFGHKELAELAGVHND